MAAYVEVSARWKRSLPAAAHWSSMGGMLSGATAVSMGYSTLGVLMALIPGAADWKRDGAFIGVVIPVITVPVSFTVSWLVPLCDPHEARTGVVPPWGCTVTMAPCADPKVGSRLRVHDA